MSTAMLRADFSDAAPLWRDAVVGASVAAMAAAAGLGSYYEIGAGTWMSIAVGGVTAAALWGAHRQIGGARAMPVRRAARVVGDSARVPAAPVFPSQPEARGLPPLVSTGAPHQAATSLPPPLPPKMTAPVDRADLSSFVLRQPPPLVPAPAPTTIAPLRPTEPAAPFDSYIAAPAEPVAHSGSDAASAVPILPPAFHASPAAIDPEAQFLRLQGLVRQLAADVGGSRAASPDPDRRATPARELPPLQVGFGGSPPPAPSPSGLPDIAPPETDLPMARLAEAVAAERFDVLLEPIQKISESRARHFEISVRFRDAGSAVLAPDEVKRVARHTGLATSIDALKLPGVAKVVQRVHSRGGMPSDVLTALAGASLADHAFLESLATSFPVGVPGGLVLSFPQADIRAFARIHWSALSALGDMGLRFALDDVADLDMDFELLRARQFVFAKIDADIFLDGLPCAGTSVPPSDIRRHLEGAGLDLIVSGIDSESQMTRIAPHAVPFGQGKLFGVARPVKADILR
jgi:cyclic-di-GMP phosphodiesterase, flagellum assembly factor TipF